MFRSFFVAAALALSTLTALPAAATGHGCQVVQFPRGAYAHQVQGYANPHSSQCFRLDVRPGQQARVRILYGPVFFSTTHTNGTYQDVRFQTVNGQLFVYVHTNHAGQHAFTIEFAFV